MLLECDEFFNGRGGKSQHEPFERLVDLAPLFSVPEDDRRVTNYIDEC